MSENLSNQDLNIWLAEHLFGFEWWRSSSSGRRGLFPPDKVPEWFKERADGTESVCHDHPSHVPDYCGNISDAWTVVDALRARGWLCVVKDMPDGFPYIIEDSNADTKLFRRACADFSWMSMRTLEETRKRIHSHCFSIADTPARAIAQSAMKAVEIDLQTK